MFVSLCNFRVSVTVVERKCVCFSPVVPKLEGCAMYAGVNVLLVVECVEYLLHCFSHYNHSSRINLLSAPSATL